MDVFNFYINVDECLNMSNFEMFFYQLQYANKFYVVNATFNDEAAASEEISGVKSIQNAVIGIRNFIGQSSFLIQDYRLIFSMRQPYKKRVEWTESVLYRLLKIYYCLQDAKLFIRTKDRADKNVTVILLYDVNNTMDEKDIRDIIDDNTRDIPLLMDYLGVDWDDKEQYPQERDIASAMLRSPKLKNDSITEKFVNDYYDWFTGHKLDTPDGYTGYETEIERTSKNASLPPAQLREAQVYNRVNNLTTFIFSQIGQYCVFTKTISNNTGDHRLALLGIVDYITTGLIDSNEDNEKYTNDNLKQKARNNWEKAKNNRAIWSKYGSMMQRYERRMQERLLSLEGRITSRKKALDIHYEEPRRISKEFEGTGYEKRIDEILKEYKSSFLLPGGGNDWDETQRRLEQLVGELDLSLEKYSEKLSDAYREELKKRSDEKKQKASDQAIYDREQIDDQINELKRRKQELLEDLKKQKMTPQVRYQDQLNVNSAIRGCSRKMHYYLQRRSQISLQSFLLFLLIAGGFVLGSHLLMQESFLINTTNVLGFAASAVIGAVFMVFCWGAPAFFYRKKILEALNILQKDLEKYTHGYTELAGNFEEYMNIINALDVINGNLQELDRRRELANLDSRMLLWHKEAIERHLGKCNFFHLLYEDTFFSNQAFETEIPLDTKKDIINNRFYWPQENNGG